MNTAKFMGWAALWLLITLIGTVAVIIVGYVMMFLTAFWHVSVVVLVLLFIIKLIIVDIGMRKQDEP